MKIKNFDTDTCYMNFVINEEGIKVETFGKTSGELWTSLNTLKFSWLELAYLCEGDKDVIAHLMSSAAILIAYSAEDEVEDEE